MIIKFGTAGFSIDGRSYRVVPAGTRAIEPQEIESIMSFLAQNHHPEKQILSVTCPRCGSALPNINALHTLGDGVSICGSIGPMVLRRKRKG